MLYGVADKIRSIPNGWLCLVVGIFKAIFTDWEILYQLCNQLLLLCRSWLIWILHCHFFYTITSGNVLHQVGEVGGLFATAFHVAIFNNQPCHVSSR